MKFGRSYECIITNNKTKQTATIKDLTCDFDVKKGIGSGINNTTLKFYNLSQNTKEMLLKDYNDNTLKINVVFKMGYNSLTTCFIGEIFESFSYRQGTEVITELACRDGGIAINTTKISKTFNNITERQIAIFLINALNLRVGILTELSTTYPRGITLEGDVFKILKDRYGNNLYIEDGVVNIINQNQEYVDYKLDRVFSKETGLLETPRRFYEKYMIKVLLEPQLKVNELITIKSDVESRFNGSYKVISLQHRGTISQTAGGSASTQIECLLVSKKLKAVSL